MLPLYIHPDTCLTYVLCHMPYIACIPAPCCNIQIAHIKCNVIKRDLFCFSVVSPIPEISPGGQDSVSAMCQQLSRGLSLLSSSDDFGPMPLSHAATSSIAKQLFATPPGMNFQKKNSASYLVILYFSKHLQCI